MPLLPVFLFDIDGVLVAPLGYRQAVRVTLAYFFDRMRFPAGWLPDEYALAGFEAVRITSEWDMVPICQAAAIDRWLVANPHLSVSGELTGVIDQISRAPSSAGLPASIDYHALQAKLTGRLPVGVYPADTVLALARMNQPPRLFERLNDPALLASLLANSRDLERSQTTRLFQHYTLGSAAFQSSYRLPAMLQTESLLRRYDRPQISPELSRRIAAMRSQKRVFPAAFTMRPSLAPRGVAVDLPYHYVPEAEIALELVHLDDIPLIGYGRMVYLAGELGLEPETLLKPSPVQAIAAILAAITGDERLGLRTAYHVYAKSGDLNSIVPAGDGLHIHVFEDSAGGIEAVQKAAVILSAAGIQTSLTAYGIAEHPDKISALAQAGAGLYESTEQAIRQALAQVEKANP